MKLLVTGGLGFIGSAFIRHILKKYDYDVINLDLMTYASNPDSLKCVESNPHYNFVKGDINDSELVLKLISNCDAIINFAAESHVDKSFYDERKFYKTNLFGVINLVECARKANIKKFLQISTDEVYGENLTLIPHDEKSILSPTNPYSASKAASDLYVLSIYKAYNFPVTISRSSNNYGLYQNPEKFIPSMIEKLFKNDNIEIYASGEQIRDWLYVEDNVRALDILLHEGRNGEIYNISGNNLIKNIDVAKMVLSILDLKENRISHIKDRISHDRRYFISSKKIENEFNFKPKANFKEELTKIIDFKKEHI